MTWDVPLRLLGGLHALVLTGRASWDDLDAAFEQEDLPELAARPVQTNEVRRSWALLPCFLDVARRTGADTFDLIELGPSGGFNLMWDRYRYRYEAESWGPPDAPLELDGDERRPVPGELLSLTPRVRRRVGLDLDPVDVTTEEGALRLRSFVWPGQAGRMERLDRAIEVVRREPPELVRGDMADVLPQLLAERSSDVLTVVFQTAVLGYLGDERWARVREALAHAGRDGSLAFIWTDRPAEDVHAYWGLWLQLWPGDGPELLAHADFHGAWLAWLGTR
ncbi:MAG: DUF2332 domain-containing protein [Actinobacteria bacterium]|nr:DUF2332 domain-containing protein [Actinomycetota bacterium]